MDDFVRHSSARGHQLIRGIVFSIGMCVAIVLIVVLLGLRGMRHAPIGAMWDGMIGPLHILHIDKTAGVGQGFGLTFTFRKELVIVLALCIGIQLFCVVVCWRYRCRQKVIKAAK